jgi:GAF domain-containing protein
VHIAPIPENESARLQALRRLLLLDTPPEARFDRIVEFAANEFSVPMALISLVDENRQWFKAKVGLEACETGRDISFCGHAITEPDLFVVEDTHRSAAFWDNPLVRGDPHIRFYAGAQLRLPTGEVIGTLCLLDTVARVLDPTDCTILGVLRDLAVEEILANKGCA